MRYLIYTDAAASTQKKISGCSYIILTDRMYVSSDSIKIEETYNPTHAEVVSIGLAAAYILDNIEVSQDDLITISSDCLSAVNFCRDNINSQKNVNCSSKIVRSSIKVIRMLNKKCRVVFQKVHGHKGVLNPNMVADRLAKLPLRRD